jgi:hypothetical protein
MKTKYGTVGVSISTPQALSAGKMEAQKATELDQLVSEMSMTVSTIRLYVNQMQQKLSQLSYYSLEDGDAKAVASPEPQTITDRLRQLSSSQTSIMSDLESLVNFVNRTI